MKTPSMFLALPDSLCNHRRIVCSDRDRRNQSSSTTASLISGKLINHHQHCSSADSIGIIVGKRAGNSVSIMKTLSYKNPGTECRICPFFHKIKQARMIRGTHGVMNVLHTSIHTPGLFFDFNENFLSDIHECITCICGKNKDNTKN